MKVSTHFYMHTHTHTKLQAFLVRLFFDAKEIKRTENKFIFFNLAFKLVEL
jgi:hypothetical protein